MITENPIINDIKKNLVIHGRNRSGHPHATLVAYECIIPVEGEQNVYERVNGGERRFLTKDTVKREDHLIIWGITQCMKGDSFSKKYGTNEAKKRLFTMAKLLGDYPGRPRDSFTVAADGMMGHAPAGDMREVLEYFYSHTKSYPVKKERRRPGGRAGIQFNK